PGGVLPDLLVAGPRGVAELGHVAEDGEAAAPVSRTARGQVRECVERGPDGFGVRVVGVVDDRYPIPPLVDLHPPPAARSCRPEPVRDAVEAEAEFAGQGR